MRKWDNDYNIIEFERLYDLILNYIEITKDFLVVMNE